MSAILEIPTLPRSLVLNPPLTDEEFEKLCLASENAQLERTKEGWIEVNPPAAGFASDANSEITYQLRAWWHSHKRGRVFDSSAGFFLPDGSMLSPDAAYIRKDKSRQITEEEGQHFLHVCPDFIVELLSPSDNLAKTKAKLEAWINNGVELGWLVDPYRKEVLVYEPGKAVHVETGNVVQGRGPVEGFRLELREVWRSFQLEE
jgi:Uma2 family endonuclease